MGNINVGRWILGGIVAAVILFIVDFILNGLILAEQWSAAMAALQKPAAESAGSFVLFILVDLVIGLTAVWIYAGIRPRFGPGVTTAIYAGLATWLLAGVVPNLVILAIGLLPAGLIWTIVVVGLVQVTAATVAGAYLYQES